MCYFLADSLPLAQGDLIVVRDRSAPRLATIRTVLRTPDAEYLILDDGSRIPSGQAERWTPWAEI